MISDRARQKKLARVWKASQACNLPGVLRAFLTDADILWEERDSPEEASILIVWADIVLNLLGRPDQSRIMDAYRHAREASIASDSLE